VGFAHWQADDRQKERNIHAPHRQSTVNLVPADPLLTAPVFSTSHLSRSMSHHDARRPRSAASGFLFGGPVQQMKRLIVTTMMVCAAAATLGAQQPGPPRRGPAPMPGPGAMGARPGAGPVEDPAQFLLGHTGEFGLTDAQVTRLAAIARRSAERRRSLRAQMDSMRPERTLGARPDSGMRERLRQGREQMRPAMDRIREQARADRRDAIAVLTPDQQALAWERIAARGDRQRAEMRRGARGPGRPGFRDGAMPGNRMRRPDERR
jgi:hypothetical protein